MQVIGFVFLILGTFVYNDLVVTTQMRKMGWLKAHVSREEEPLLAGKAHKQTKNRTLTTYRPLSFSLPNLTTARGENTTPRQPERIIIFSSTKASACSPSPCCTSFHKNACKFFPYLFIVRCQQPQRKVRKTLKKFYSFASGRSAPLAKIRSNSTPIGKKNGRL
jgi:hypothetical protein